MWVGAGRRSGAVPSRRTGRKPAMQNAIC
jgi:hypothetical protein